MKTTVSIILLVIVFLSVINTIICTNNTYFCKFYLRKSWKIWEKVCKAIPKAIIVKKENCDVGMLYRLIVWTGDSFYWIAYFPEEKLIGILNTNNKVIASSYDEYHSNIAIELLDSRIKELESADPCVPE